MENKSKLKKIEIKSCTCFYFDGEININDLPIDNILLDEKLCESYLIYDIADKTSYGANSLRIIVNKVEGYIRKYDTAKYLYIFFVPMKKRREFLIELDTVLC